MIKLFASQSSFLTPFLFSFLQLLANITEKFDTIIGSFTHLDKEFLHLKQITKSSKFMESIQELRNDISMSVNLAWATLHSLLHSERTTYRQNGYIWLGDLLIAEISEENGGSIWLSIKDLQQKIAHCGASDSVDTSDIPVSIHLLCGLLKSRNSVIRWGFLFILERLLMRSKFLLDENETQRSTGASASQDHKDRRLEKANAVIDIMSSALSLMAQINETDRINILKVHLLRIILFALKLADIYSTYMFYISSNWQRTRFCLFLLLEIFTQMKFNFTRVLSLLFPSRCVTFFSRNCA